MAKLYFNQLTPTAVSASSAASSYPAANAALQSIDRPWNSTTIAAPSPATVVDYNLGTNKKIAAVYWHDINADAPYNEAWIGSVGGTYVAGVTPTPYTDRYGRTRLLAVLPTNTYAQFIRSQMSSNVASTTAELTFTATAQGATANKYTYWRIQAPSYVVASGDVLRYDVFVATANPADGGSNQGAGGMELNLLSTPFRASLASVVDGGSRAINSTPSGTRATWITRAVSLTPIAGNTITTIDLVNENDTAGTYTCKYRNVRITDAGGGTEKLLIWKGGPTALNVDDYSIAYFGQTITTQGSPTDGLAYWRVGSVYAMQDVVSIVPPQYGFDVETMNPQLASELINGVTALASTGNRYDKIRGTFMVANDGSFSIQNLMSALRAGVCILDLELGNAPHRIWPLKIIRANDKESLKYPTYTEIDFEAVEVV